MTIDELMKRDYKSKYFDVCHFIWKNYVPKSGQSDCLQGELLREIEKLRYEAQDNGNINWDKDFTYFCDFIRSTLINEDIYSDEDKEEIKLIMNYFKECGGYSQKFKDGEYNPLDVAYVGNNLYDIICDKIAMLHNKYNKPIPYNKNDKLHR